VQGTLSPFIPFHLRNYAGGMWQMYLAGNVSRQDAKLSRLLARIEAAKAKDETGAMIAARNIRVEQANGEVRTGLQYLKEMRENGTLRSQMLHGAEFDKMSMRQSIQEGTSKGVPGLRQVLRRQLRKPTAAVDSKFPRASAAMELWGRVPVPHMGGPRQSSHNNLLYKIGEIVGDTLENQQRAAIYLSRRRAGMSPELARAEVGKWMYDYSESLTKTEKWFRRGAPFYSWFRHNTPRQIIELLSQARKCQRADIMIKAFEEATGEQMPKSALRDYARKGGNIRLGVDAEGSQLYASLMGWWIGAAGAMGEEVGLNPLLTVPFELATGIDVFRTDLDKRKLVSHTPIAGELDTDFAGAMVGWKTKVLVTKIRWMSMLNTANFGSMFGAKKQPATTNLLKPLGFETAVARTREDPPEIYRWLAATTGLNIRAERPSWRYSQLKSEHEQAMSELKRLLRKASDTGQTQQIAQLRALMVALAASRSRLAREAGDAFRISSEGRAQSR